LVVATAVRRAVAYHRVSSQQQAGEKHSSLETQAQHVVAYCTHHGLRLVRSFSDVMSGKRDDRKAYQEMVAFCLQGGADVVIVQFLDRLGRRPPELLRRIWELQDHGIKVEATDEDIREELVLLVKAAVAGAESKRNSERVRSYMRERVQKGSHAARPPYGLRPVRGERGQVERWEIDEKQGPVVREMYRMAVEDNMGYKGIADRLQGMGIPAPHGKAWASFSVQGVLSNDALHGVLTYGKRPKKGNPATEVIRVPNVFPSILTETEWARLQERLAIRRGSARGPTHRSDYLLSGIARCGYCGGPMVGRVGAIRKNGTARYRNYWCTRASHSRGACQYYNGHSAPKLEAAILEYLGQFTDPDKVRELLQTQDTETDGRQEQELIRATARLKELETAFLADLDRVDRGILNESEYAKRQEVRRMEQARLQPRKAELEANIAAQRDREAQVKAVPMKVGSFLEDFGSMEVTKAKAILQTILKAAHVWKGGKIELEFR